MMVGLFTLMFSAAATIPQALPATELSATSKQRLAAAVERLLSDSEGVPTTLVKAWWYEERDGSRSVCGAANFGGTRSIFVLNTSTRVTVDPSERQFDRVCSREEQNELR